MRWNRICLPVVLLALAVAGVQAEEKADKPAPKERPKPVAGQVTAVSVGGDSVSWSLKTKEAEKTLSMSSSVNVMLREDGGKNIVVGMHIAGGKAEKPRNDKMKLVVATVTAASLDGEIVKFTLTTADGAVEAQMPAKLMAMVDKDGKMVGLRSGGDMGKDAPKDKDKEHPKEKKKEKPGKDAE